MCWSQKQKAQDKLEINGKIYNNKFGKQFRHSKVENKHLNNCDF